jgi:oxalate---CoA ligase
VRLALPPDYLVRRLTDNSRRVGFEETSTTFVLPETVSQLHSSWDVLVQPDNSPVWEFLWESKVDENREKGLLQAAFTTDNDDAPTIRGGPSSSQEVQVAEAALKVRIPSSSPLRRCRPLTWQKMVFGTPNESYDPSRAAALLHSVGEQPVSKAKDNLLNRGVLSKLVRDSQKSKPGRTLKISEM